MQCLDAAFHHIQAHAPARHFRHLLGRGEARLENQPERLFVAQFRIRRHQAALDCARPDRLAVEPCAIVPNPDQHVRAGVHRRQHHRSPRRLTGGLALLRSFDSMVDGVADQVDQRIAQLVDHRLVDLGVAALHHQFHLLAQARRKVAARSV